MTQPTNENRKQNKKSFGNNQNTGTEYHEKRAGEVEGYGEPYPVNNAVTDRTEDNRQ